MSEAADAERDVEDFFNEEIFGAPKPVENDEPFPKEDPPEPKPLEEVVLETPTPQEEAEDAADAADEEADETVELPVEEEEAVEDDAHLAWARKKFGEGIDLEGDTNKMLAKAAYEQEKLLGKQAEERRRFEQEQEARAKQAQADEIEQKIALLNTPGFLTPEEDAWVDEVVNNAADPGEYAWGALQEQMPHLYVAIRNRWASQGESEAARATAFHSQVQQFLSQPQMSPAESYASDLGQTFVELGLDIDAHGPTILAKLDELGPQHWTVEAIQSPDPTTRANATRAVVDLIRAGQTTVSRARQDDVVQARVQEEKLREAASGVNSGGPRVEKPKTSPFWSEFEAEEERINSRPQYGRSE